MSTKKGIGFSPLTERIYIGRQDRKKGMWIGEKEDITNDFIGVMFQYIESNSMRTFGNGDGVDKTLMLHVDCNKDAIEKSIKLLQQKLTELDTSSKSM